MPQAKRAMSSSPAREEHPVSPPHEDALLVVFAHGGFGGYSLYSLGLDFEPADDAEKDLPDPILSFGAGGRLPLAMGFFISGSRLYMVGGIGSGSGYSTETYHIDLKDIASLNADSNLLLRQGPDLKVGRNLPLVFLVGGRFHIISSDLSESSLVERFDPSTDSWALLPDELPDMPENTELEAQSMYLVESHMVDAARIYLYTRSGIYVFDTDSVTWTEQENVIGSMPDYSWGDGRGCFESSRFYVACGKDPSSLLLYPKHEVYKFTKFLCSGDLLAPYEDYVSFRRNPRLFQVSRDRFCFVCEGYDVDPLGFYLVEKQYLVLQLFDLVQQVPPADDPHRVLSRVLYTMDNLKMDYGEMLNGFLINRNNVFGHNASKRPRLEDSQK